MPWGRYRASRRLSALRPVPFVARTPPDLGGHAYRCDLGDAICREVYFTGRYEPAKTQLVRALVRPGDTVIDLGANWGYFTLAAAHWTGPSGRVVAFEPDPRLFQLLQGNVALNALPAVTPVQAAVGERRGSGLFLGYEEGAENRGVTRRAADGTAPHAFRTDVVALDEWCRGAHVDHVRLVKVDVEGDEHRALRGMAEGLGRAAYDYVLLECHPDALREQHVTFEAMLGPLTSSGYALHVIDFSPATYSLAARRALPLGELVEAYTGQPLGDWPHLLAVSPRMPPLR